MVSTNISGIPELIENGVNGLLVEADDDAALSAALRQIVENPGQRAEMGEAGRQRVQREFQRQ